MNFLHCTQTHVQSHNHKLTLSRISLARFLPLLLPLLQRHSSDHTHTSINSYTYSVVHLSCSRDPSRPLLLSCSLSCFLVPSLAFWFPLLFPLLLARFSLLFFPLFSWQNWRSYSRANSLSLSLTRVLSLSLLRSSLPFSLFRIFARSLARSLSLFPFFSLSRAHLFSLSLLKHISICMLCLFVSVCVWTCLYVSVCVFVCICVSACIRVCVCVCISICIRIHTYTYTYIYVYTYSFVCM